MTTPTHTRKEAAALGLHKYWNGRPCKRDHHALRYTATGACTACIRGYNEAFETTRANAAMGRKRGLVPLTLLVHPDDEAAAREFIAALIAARNLMEPAG